MPFLDLKNGRVHYRFDGSTDVPTIVLINSLGTNLSMWDPQVSALAQHFHVLRYDTRGHGLSAVPAGPYTITDLSRDCIDMLDGLGIERAHVCGLSQGGMIAQWLGIYASERVNRLLLCNTAARIGSPVMWNTRIAMVLEGGMASIASAMIQRWFTGKFIAGAPETVDTIRKMLLASPAKGYVACCEALRDADLTEEVSRITAHTLVITGAHDPATPPAAGRLLSEKISGARHVELESSHLSNVEAAQPFTQAMLHFLISQEA